MTWKDKLEIGLKEDAPFRKDNLPESQVRGPEIPAGPGRSPEIPLARGDHSDTTDGKDSKDSRAPAFRAKADRRRGASSKDGGGGPVGPARAQLTPVPEAQENAATSEGMPESAEVKKVITEA
jgi:hypothetical protein